VPVGSASRTRDAALVDRLRAGDESAFAWLVDRYSAPLMRLARAFVPSSAVAEDVVQETWLAVITGIARFEARSSLKTWLFTILVNRAKSRASREGRTIPFSALEHAGGDREPSVEASRFLPPDHPQWPHHWAVPPQPWSLGPEGAALDRETVAVLRKGLDQLSPAQRTVVALRDVHGWPAAEVCTTLQITEANQRVLLHRGRSRLRAVLESYFTDHVGAGEVADV
jgi:RNA polymerase sigma-70 factor (ECF subfamily)